MTSIFSTPTPLKSKKVPKKFIKMYLTKHLSGIHNPSMVIAQTSVTNLPPYPGSSFLLTTGHETPKISDFRLNCAGPFFKLKTNELLRILLPAICIHRFQTNQNRSSSETVKSRSYRQARAARNEDSRYEIVTGFFIFGSLPSGERLKLMREVKIRLRGLEILRFCSELSREAATC